MWNPSLYDFECNKTCKIDEFLDNENCSCKKRQLDKLMIACEDEILNSTETLFNNNIGTYENFIGNYRHVIISCFFY